MRSRCKLFGVELLPAQAYTSAMTRWLLLCLALLGCGSDESAATPCTPGTSQPCACPSGPVGQRTCDSAGSTFGACECGSSGASGASVGGSSGSAGEGGGGTGAGGTSGQSGSGGSAVCVSGQSMACACTNGQTGAQSCNSDGSGYDECVCTGGAGGSGGSGLVCAEWVVPTNAHDERCVPVPNAIHCSKECNLPKYEFSCTQSGISIPSTPGEECILTRDQSSGADVYVACCPLKHCGLSTSSFCAQGQKTISCLTGDTPDDSACTLLVSVLDIDTYCCPQLLTRAIDRKLCDVLQHFVFRRIDHRKQGERYRQRKRDWYLW